LLKWILLYFTSCKIKMFQISQMQKMLKMIC
jgi:hypothetical protein